MTGAQAPHLKTRWERWLPVLRSPVFWIVLALKLVASARFGSHYVRDLFLPFVTYFIDSGFQNPWDHFAFEGKFDAFPYSGVMLALLSAPQAVMSAVFPGWVHASEGLRLFLIRIPMLFADFTIFAILCHWFPSKRDKALWVYWCSPILFYISYIHGQIDSIPTALLFVSLLFVFRKKAFLAGFFLGLGLATKLHLLVALPFLAAYFWNNHKGAQRIEKTTALLAGALFTVTDMIVPFMKSPGYRAMVFGTPESRRLFDIAIPLTDELKLYVAPAAVILIFMRFASTPKINRDLTILFIALAFGAMVLLVPPMPGWYFWSLPFACYFYIRQESVTDLSLWLVNAFYILYYAVFWRNEHAWNQAILGVRLDDLVFTAMQSSLAMGIFWIYRIGILSNREYLTRNPTVLIGIGGDSGTGKHTLAAKLGAFVGVKNSMQANGDDYHRWAREHEGWKTTTHLNPRSNHMFLPVEHLRRLKEGKAVEHPVYDHKTGRFTDPVEFVPRRFTFFIGLHPFYIRSMRALMDLKIYMDPDEALRKHWKVERDRKDRGYTPEQVLDQLKSREGDSKNFIHPQREFADWIVSYGLDLTPRHILRNDLPVEELVHLLRALPGFDVAWDLHPDMERQVIELKGAIPAEEIQRIAFRLFPNLQELIGEEYPEWSEGYDGVAQLIFLALLDDVTRNPA